MFHGSSTGGSTASGPRGGRKLPPVEKCRRKSAPKIDRGLKITAKIRAEGPEMPGFIGQNARRHTFRKVLQQQHFKEVDG